MADIVDILPYHPTLESDYHCDNCGCTWRQDVSLPVVRLFDGLHCIECGHLVWFEDIEEIMKDVIRFD